MNVEIDFFNTLINKSSEIDNKLSISLNDLDDVLYRDLDNRVSTNSIKEDLFDIRSNINNLKKEVSDINSQNRYSYNIWMDGLNDIPSEINMLTDKDGVPWILKNIKSPKEEQVVNINKTDSSTNVEYSLTMEDTNLMLSQLGDIQASLEQKIKAMENSSITIPNSLISFLMYNGFTIFEVESDGIVIGGYVLENVLVLLKRYQENLINSKEEYFDKESLIKELILYEFITEKDAKNLSYEELIDLAISNIDNLIFPINIAVDVLKQTRIQKQEIINSIYALRISSLLLAFEGLNLNSDYDELSHYKTDYTDGIKYDGDNPKLGTGIILKGKLLEEFLLHFESDMSNISMINECITNETFNENGEYTSIVIDSKYLEIYYKSIRDQELRSGIESMDYFGDPSEIENIESETGKTDFISFLLSFLNNDGDFKYYTEEQKQDYWYLMTKDGKEKASDYQFALLDGINQIKGIEESTKYINRMIDEGKSGFEKIFDSTAQGFWDTTSKQWENFTNFFSPDGIKSALDYEMYFKTLFLTMNYSEEIIQHYNKKFESGEITKEEYDRNIGLLNNINAMDELSNPNFRKVLKTGYGIGSDLSIIVPMIGGMITNPIAASFYMAAFSAGGKLEESYQTYGKLESKHYTNAAITFLSTGLSQYLLGGLPGLSKGAGKIAPKNFKEAIAIMHKNAVSEVGQELFELGVDLSSSAIILEEFYSPEEIANMTFETIVKTYAMTLFLNGSNLSLNYIVNASKEIGLAYESKDQALITETLKKYGFKNMDSIEYTIKRNIDTVVALEEAKLKSNVVDALIKDILSIKDPTTRLSVLNYTIKNDKYFNITFKLINSIFSLNDINLKKTLLNHFYNKDIDLENNTGAGSIKALLDLGELLGVINLEDVNLNTANIDFEKLNINDLELLIWANENNKRILIEKISIEDLKDFLFSGIIDYNEYIYDYQKRFNKMSRSELLSFSSYKGDNADITNMIESLLQAKFSSLPLYFPNYTIETQASDNSKRQKVSVFELLSIITDFDSYIKFKNGSLKLSYDNQYLYFNAFKKFASMIRASKNSIGLEEYELKRVEDLGKIYDEEYHDVLYLVNQAKEQLYDRGINKILFNGLLIAKPKNFNFNFQNIRVKDLIQVFNKMPIKLSGATKGLYLYDEECPRDIYWRVAYSSNHKSSAEGGDGNIYIYSPASKSWNSGTLEHILFHEAAHNFDSQLIRHNFSGTPEWQKAISSDKNTPSEYAKTNSQEDFAESVAHYFINPEEFKKNFPNRAAYLIKIFK